LLIPNPLSLQLHPPRKKLIYSNGYVCQNGVSEIVIKASKIITFYLFIDNKVVIIFFN